MFEVNMSRFRALFSFAFLFYTFGIEASAQTPVDFIPEFKKGERLVYRLVETEFRQNQNGHYLFLMYDTSYLTFNVTDKNDSQTLINFNYADAYIDGKLFNHTSTTVDYLRTETYQLTFDNRGEFIELSNWEIFAGIIIDNFRRKYINNEIDSNTLKYYYIYYHSQENVEKAVLARVFDLFNILGETYALETNYSLAREMVNPFGGNNLQKSCLFKPYKDDKYPNSVFFSGKLATTSEDNDCLQEDYYNYINQKKPDIDSDISPPFIYMVDTYNYQWGTISKQILSYTSTHTLHFGTDKRGLDRVYMLYSF